MEATGSSGNDEVELENLVVEFPSLDEGKISQDEEWCIVHAGGESQEIRFHDYGEIYNIPGLYETIFCDHLHCRSPQIVGAMLEQEVLRTGQQMEELRVIDVGAGNGIMGEVLEESGVKQLVGVDILPEAAEAAERDRPGVYDAYHAVDLTDIPAEVREEMEERRFNCMTLIAALGFGDIPPEVFTEGFNLVENDGLIAFNIKREFLKNPATSEFAELIQRLIEESRFDPSMQLDYIHRLSSTGEPLYYTAFVGQKLRDIPATIIP